jgi:CIC family chloride channel protein
MSGNRSNNVASCARAVGAHNFNTDTLAPGSTAPPPRADRAPPMFYRSVREFLRDLPGSAKRFWVLLIATGVAAGIGAVALMALLHAVEQLAWPAGGSFLESVEAAPAWQRIVVPTIGGLLVMGAALMSHRPLGGHGTAGILEAIWLSRGRLSLGRALLRGAVSIIAVAMGAPLGREGALLQSGAAAGSWLGAKLRIPGDQVRLLVACGAAAGVAAAYNVPIGGALFGLEVFLGSFALEMFGPMVVCCVVATLISRTLVANHPSYLIPHYALLRPRELLLGVVFAPLLGLASALYTRGIDVGARWFESVPRRVRFFLPPIALAICGLIAVWLPQILGNGYDPVDDALLGRLPLSLLVILPLAKLFATSLVAGAGVPGGLFTPSLFYGAMLGGALGHVAQLIFGTATPVGAYALMGMGAVLAGTTHASISAVLIIFELTGDYDIILPLMLTCVISAAVSRRISAESLYTSVLARRKVKLPEVPRPDWLRAIRVRDLMRTGAQTISLSEKFDDVLMKLLSLPAGQDLYVIDPDGRYLGVIVLDMLKGHIPDRSLLGMLIAADVMDRSIAPVTPDTALSPIVERFQNLEIDKLPVVDPATQHLLGTVSKTDLLRRRRF